MLQKPASRRKFALYRAGGIADHIASPCMKASRLSYSLLVPMIALVVWAVLVPTPALANYLFLLHASHGADPVRLHFGHFGVVVPRGRLFLFCLEPVAYRASHLITGLNLPGVLASILISLPSMWPSVWSPVAFPFEAWRAVAYPFYCLPWWWFAGCSLDGFVGQRKMGWIFLSVGSLLCFFCMFLDAGMYFEHSAHERAGFSWMFAGFTLWAILFAIAPLAWWRQRRKLRNALVEDAAPADTNGAASAAPSHHS